MGEDVAVDGCEGSLVRGEDLNVERTLPRTDGLVHLMGTASDGSGLFRKALSVGFQATINDVL